MRVQRRGPVILLSRRKKAAIIEDYKAGLPIELICRRHKVGIDSPRRLAREAGLAQRGKNNALAKDVVEAILRDYLRGDKLEGIAHRYGVSTTAPRMIAKRRGIPPRNQAAVHPSWKTEARLKWLREQVEREEYSGSAYRASEQVKCFSG